MQALTTWHEPTGVLGTLVAEGRGRALALSGRRAALRAAAAAAPPPADFAAALRGSGVAVVAEIKRRSPSRGDINPALGLAERVLGYAAGGAAALSVLTEATRFGGSADDLAEARRLVDIPLLRKDFLVDPLQLVEARALGASAVLLIARAVPAAELRVLALAAADQGLQSLIEVRSERELESALEAGASVIGVNNRNLETLEIDPATSERLVPLIPADRPAIYESGVVGRRDVERAAACGADAVLVGSTLSAAPDAAAAVRALSGVPRLGRGA